MFKHFEKLLRGCRVVSIHSSENKIKNIIMKDLSNALGYDMGGSSEVPPIIEKDFIEASNILRDLERLRNEVIANVKNKLEILKKNFKRTATIINIVGAAALGVGLVVTLPLTYILYKFKYEPHQNSLEEEVKRLENEAKILNNRYKTIIERMAQKLRTYVEERHYMVMGKDKLVKIETFEELRKLLKEHNIIVNHFNCPICNTVLTIPYQGKVYRCPNCGFKIKPRDIYRQLMHLFK